jgi:hypothetical protein
MGAPARPSPAEVPYLSCRACGLSVRSRNPLTERAYCPRCSARGRVEPLLHSALPPHLSNRHNAGTAGALTNGAIQSLCQPANISGSGR